MLKKAFFTNSGGILCSRIFGFLRDVCMASILGAGVYSDIFFIAFKLPNLFRRIFGEGAFTQSFLPSLIHSRHKGVFSLSIFIIFSLILLILGIFVFFSSSWVTKLLAFGFSEQTIALASPVVAINFWYLWLVFCVTFFGSLLQYKHIFWVSAYNTALLNICMIASLIYAKDMDKMQIVYFLSYGVLLGGVAQILIHLYPLYNLGFFKLFYLSSKHIKSFLQNKSKKSQRFYQEFKSFFAQFFPALIGGSTAQLLAFIETFIASFLSAGSISYLYYANRIFQLPLALFAIAISTALFPLVAKAIKNKEPQKALEAMGKSFWFLCIALCVCTLGGVMLKDEIIWLLYKRGSFSAQDVSITANVFALYLLGLLPFGLSKILSLWLYSHSLQGKAAKFSIISLSCGTLLSFILIAPLGVLGIAISSSISGFILLFLNIKAIGKKNFLSIIVQKKWSILLITTLVLEGGLLYGFKLLIQGYIQ